MPVIGWSSARQRRIAVDDTSAVCASIKMIDGSAVAGVFERRPDHARRQLRQPARQLARRASGPRHHDEMRGVENVRIVLPRVDVGERVGADQKNSSDAA